MRKKSLLLAVFLSLTSLLFAQRQPKQQPNQVRDFMRQKLAASQSVLEGIAVEDFDKVKKNAEKLSLLSRESSWQVLQTPDYLEHSKEFRRVADSLADAAKNHKGDAAALAYVDLTMKCVNCHKYVRGVRMAQR